MNIRKIIGDLETRRKVFHLFALLLWLPPLYLFPGWLLTLLFVIVIVMNLITLLRLWEDRLRPYYLFVYKLERRRNYSKPGIQALWANLGIFLSFLLFGRESALVAVVVLAVGDAFASVVGMRYGRRRIGERSIEGSLAFFFSTLLVLALLIGLWKALLVSFFSALVELLPLRLDDNFTVPIVAGLVYYVIK
ncbi:MAG: phosphatidate cytidylyltransferase [Aquificaceae bacterium]|nr:phosphatidate cytidylyltransferase [Aquificaceae bacterium]MCX8163771.1 phosphatidate cytidylyltransferase [Aquificaceae bacterium]